MKIESEKIVYSSSRFKVVRQVILHNNIREKKEIVEMGTGIAIVALDADNNVFMIREWRSAFNDFIIQIPGGYCGHNDEDSLVTSVKEEAREEIGITKSTQLQKLKTYYPSGAIRTTISVYLMTGAQITKPPQLEATEHLHVVKFPFLDAYNRFVLGNECTTSATVIGLACAKKLLFPSHPLS